MAPTLEAYGAWTTHACPSPSRPVWPRRAVMGPSIAELQTQCRSKYGTEQLLLDEVRQRQATAVKLAFHDLPKANFLQGDRLDSGVH